MSTNAIIYAKQADGTIKGIYLHWDGYLSNAGKTLLHSYTDPKKIDKLIHLGGLSSLGKEYTPSELIGKFGFEADMLPVDIDEKHTCAPKEWVTLSHAERKRLMDANKIGENTIAYHRDRKEKIEIETLASEQKLKARESLQAYEYYWNGEMWYWRRNKIFKPLTDEVIAKNDD